MGTEVYPRYGNSLSLTANPWAARPPAQAHPSAGLRLPKPPCLSVLIWPQVKRP